MMSLTSFKTTETVAWEQPAAFATSIIVTHRPVMVLGVDAPGAGHAALHDMMVTRDWYDALPDIAKKHLVCRVVYELVPITQKYDIEGLVMGVEQT